MKKKIGKVLKYTLIVIGSILVLVTIAIYSLQFPSVQNYVKTKLVGYLEKKIKTKVSLDRIYVNFPNKIELENLFLQGQDVDTLLYVQNLNVGLHLPTLLQNKAELTSIELNGLKANVIKRQNGSFNFNYILDAFGSEETVEKEPSKPFIINLDKIHLQNLGISYKDQSSKNDIAVKLSDLNTVVNTFDLQENTYKLDFLDAKGLKLSFNQGLFEEVAKNVEEKVDSLSENKPLQIGLEKINLQDFDIKYDDENTATKANIVFEHLKTTVNTLDLPNNKYQVSDALFKNAFVDLRITPSSAADKAINEQPQTKQSTNTLQALAKNIVFDNVNIKYNYGLGNNPSNSFNANHIDIEKLNGIVPEFNFGESIEGEVKEVSFFEKSGFTLNELSAKFKYGAKETELQNFVLKTPNTLLQRNLKLQYDTIDDLSKNLGSVFIDAKLPTTKIGFKDILWLAPNLKNTAPFNKYPNAILNLSAEVKGTVNNLLVQEFKLSGIGNTTVNTVGTIKNALDPNKLWVNLKVNDLTTNKTFINNLVPKNTIPNNIEIPNNLSAKGKLKGSLNDIFVDLGLTSSFGGVKLYGTFNQQRKGGEKYDLKASLNQFQVGKLLKQKDIGSVTASATIKGTGFNFEKNNANINAYVTNATYQNYTYQNVSLNGNLNNGNYQVALKSNDENAKLDIVASGVYNANQPTIKTNGTIFKVDLQKLGFSATPMAVAGTLDGDFTSLNPDALNGGLFLKDFVLSNGEEIYPISEISLNAVSTSELNSLELKSQIIDLLITGQYKLTEISSSLLATLNQYYQFTTPGQQQAISPSQFFNFRAKVKNDDLVRKFVPDLTNFSTVNLYGAYNADEKKITVYGSVPNLEYGSFQLNDIKLSAGNDEEQLNYSVTLNALNSPQFKLDDISLDGSVTNNIINYNLLVKNETESPQYKIAGNVSTDNGIIQVHLNEDGLILNSEAWFVDASNKLGIYPNGLLAENVILFSNNSALTIASETSDPTSPLNVSFKDFKIETLTEIIKKDELLAEGTINGSAQLKNLMTDLRLTADLNVTDLKVFGNEIGNLKADVVNENAGVYDANITLSGFNNDVKLVGSYNTIQSNFDVDIDINALQMTSIQGFSMNQINDAKGYISGKIKLNGSIDKPSILGNLKFNQAGFGVTQLNTTFQNMNDQIDFTNRGIEFNSFKINDTENNPLTINGAVLTQTYRDFNFDLNISGSNFKVVNSTKSDNQILYGIMAIDANINVKGNLDLPKVDGQIKVTDTTDFTFVMPQSSPALQEREGIIEFVDQDQLALKDTLKDPSEIIDETIRGYDVNLNIEVVKDAKLSIVIDKTNGDFVKLQGEAQLTGGIDPSGKTTLLGRYEVNQGAYEMSVSLLKRKFEIQEGSTITWTGEPTKADVDITAIYKTKAAPIDLLQQQLGDFDAAEQNKYKQQIPFNTKLKMAGELLKPIITFDIEVDGNNPTVSSDIIDLTENKLDQLRTEESEMNKQVFALLLLNRFIGENPFQSSTGISAESMARQSVSRMLSQQLNNLAADLIEGVELNFDLESSDDYTTGNRETRTDLNVGISKRLLNDRLKVSIGSNFGLEGSERQNERATNIAGNIQVDYMLSKDGRYLLKAYRKDEYQLALQGQIVETGVGFVITVDYDQFKELLRKRKRNAEFRINQKQIQLKNEQIKPQSN